MTKNWDELCDEEKSYIDWIKVDFFKNQKSNLEDRFKNFDDIIKYSYMQGYAAGFQSKTKHSSEEQLQK